MDIDTALIRDAASRSRHCRILHRSDIRNYMLGTSNARWPRVGEAQVWFSMMPAPERTCTAVGAESAPAPMRIARAEKPDGCI